MRDDMVPNQAAYESADEEEAGSRSSHQRRQSVLIREQVLEVVQSYFSGKPSPAAAPAPITRAPVKIPSLPLLQSPILMSSHLGVIESLLREDGIDLGSVKARVRVVETFANHRRVYEMAGNLLSIPWNDFRHNLTECFANLPAVRQELERRISSLKFDRNSQDHHNAFPNDIRTLYQFFLGAGGITMTTSEFVSRSFTHLPPPHLAELIRACNEDQPGVLWTSIPVYTLCDRLEQICFVRNQIDEALPRRKPDLARRVQPGKSQPSSRKTWLSDLSKQFDIFYLNQYDKEQLLKVLAAAAKHYQLRRKDGGEYYVVAFAQGTGTGAMKRLLPDAAYKPFAENF